MNVFKIHVIPPPRPLNWSSPRTLLKDTFIHHLLQMSAPIGHFYLEIQSDTPNAFGVKHVVTGMSRTNNNATTVKVIREKVGLGTLFFDFPGQIDRGSEALEDLKYFESKGRLRTITIPVAPERMDVLWDEMNEWIKHGAYKHYGSLNILKGEGSGCAEFGVHFMNLALGARATPREWIRSVYAPKHLTGGHKTGRKVGMLKVYREGTTWATGPEDGFLYETPDMELTWNWLEKRFPGNKSATLNVSDVNWKTEPLKRISFETGYPVESESTIREQWKKISL